VTGILKTEPQPTLKSEEIPPQPETIETKESIHMPDANIEQDVMADLAAIKSLIKDGADVYAAKSDLYNLEEIVDKKIGSMLSKIEQLSAKKADKKKAEEDEEDEEQTSSEDDMDEKDKEDEEENTQFEKMSKSLKKLEKSLKNLNAKYSEIAQKTDALQYAARGGSQEEEQSPAHKSDAKSSWSSIGIFRGRGI
jgi:predicted RNase H-like nuclease (RuvC/YqgF family)